MSSTILRFVTDADLADLVRLEDSCFDSDRLSPRRLKHWIKAKNRIFQVIKDGDIVTGYGLVLLHKGTRLARLYSLAISPAYRGKGLARQLLQSLEDAAVKEGRLFMRLEVSHANIGAITLYKNMGYAVFGYYANYYEDHNDALRMQKCIRRASSFFTPPPVPWYSQTTNFTCGPASLMMAMAQLDPAVELHQKLELDIWREATTIFMTSGLGGCHPLGLALAAHRRGFSAEVYINTRKPLFIEGVRTLKKKEIMSTVDEQFSQRAMEENIAIHYRDVTQADIREHLAAGAMILVLISTYRFDGKKLPHWVVVTAMDDLCLYIHEPDPDENIQGPLDCQHLPIARDDFDRMSSFGKDRLRTAIVLQRARRK